MSAERQPRISSATARRNCFEGTGPAPAASNTHGRAPQARRLLRLRQQQHRLLDRQPGAAQLGDAGDEAAPGAGGDPRHPGQRPRPRRSPARTSSPPASSPASSRTASSCRRRMALRTRSGDVGGNLRVHGGDAGRRRRRRGDGARHGERVLRPDADRELAARRRHRDVGRAPAFPRRSH